MGNENSHIPPQEFPSLDNVEPLSLDEVEDYSEYDSFDDSNDYNISGYEYIGRLGSGSSGAVLLMRKGNNEYAVKVQSTEKVNFMHQNTHDPKEEAYLLKRLNHPNIIKLFDFIDDVDNHNFYIVMELLTTHIGKNSNLSIDQKKKAFGEILLGIHYIHFQRLAHRDIKVDNILLNKDGVAKLCDFGISTYVPIGQTKIKTETIGTPAYCAPELFNTTEYDPFKADVWAFGVTLFILAYNQLPFPAHDLFEQQRVIINNDPFFPEKVSDEVLKDLLLKMLEKDPEKRISIEEIWQHPWCSGIRPRFAKAIKAITNVVKIFGDLKATNIIVSVSRGVIQKTKRRIKHRRQYAHQLATKLMDLRAHNIQNIQGIHETHRNDIKEI